MTCPGWTAAEIEKLRMVLSSIYCTRDRAVAFVRAVGFIRYPEFKDNEEFWHEIFYEGANGAIPDYCHRILDFFELKHRNNPAVRGRPQGVSAPHVIDLVAH
jgi:hypothetical protein